MTLSLCIILIYYLKISLTLLFDTKDKDSDALAIMPLIIMFYILQQNGIAQGQNNNDKFSPLHFL
jgi:hypothetical protein